METRQVGPGTVLLLGLVSVEAKAAREGREPTSDEYRSLIKGYVRNCPRYFVVRQSWTRSIATWLLRKIEP
jgi:hypothetical protein